MRSHLREVGEERWSVLALPPIVLGSTLFAVLTGMEVALGAAAETGGDVQAAQAALFPWFVPVLVTGAVSYALGAFGFAMGIARSALWPLAYQMSRHPEAQPSGHPRPLPAT